MVKYVITKEEVNESSIFEHVAVGLMGFNEAMPADRREAPLHLHAQVELVEALAIAIDLEVEDGPGCCFQEVDHCPDVTIGGRPLPLDLLDRHEARLVERGVDVPSLTRWRPLWWRSLQGGNEVRPAPFFAPLGGQERPPTLEDAGHFPGTKGGRTGEHQIKGRVRKWEASAGPLIVRLRAARIRTSRISPDHLDPKRRQPPSGLRDVGRIRFRSPRHRWERGQAREHLTPSRTQVEDGGSRSDACSCPLFIQRRAQRLSFHLTLPFLL